MPPYLISSSFIAPWQLTTTMTPLRLPSCCARRGYFLQRSWLLPTSCARRAWRLLAPRGLAASASCSAGFGGWGRAPGTVTPCLRRSTSTKQKKGGVHERCAQRRSSYEQSPARCSRRSPPARRFYCCTSLRCHVQDVTHSAALFAPGRGGLVRRIMSNIMTLLRLRSQRGAEPLRGPLLPLRIVNLGCPSMPH